MARKSVYNSPEDVGFNPTGASSGGGYDNIETEVSRVDNGNGTFTVTYRGSTDPNAPTYTRIVGTKIVSPAPPDFTAATALYEKVGNRVTGKIQDYIKEVYDGMLSGKYSIADAVNAFEIVDIQRDQGFTGLEGSPSVDDKVDVSSIYDLYNTVGARVTGSVQAYLDEIYAGAKTGKYSISDVQNAFNTVNLQADQGMTGAYGAAQGVVAVAPVDKVVEIGDEFATATSIIQAVLKFYGMTDPRLLADVKLALAERRLTETSSIDDIGIQLRESVAFQERFSANEVRRAAKKPVYSVTEYLQLESSYRNTLLAAGMPEDFYNSPEDFANFIANDISPDEIKSRVDLGYASVKNADPAIVNELKSLYGLDDSTLAAFFIDPSRTKDAVVRAARAAEVASQARQQAGISLGVSAAELLVQQGVTQEEARQGFAQVSQLQELTRPLQGEKPLTQEELIAGKLGTNAAATQRVAMTQRRRKAGFEEGGKVGLTAVGE